MIMGSQGIVQPTARIRSCLRHCAAKYRRLPFWTWASRRPFPATSCYISKALTLGVWCAGISTPRGTGGASTCQFWELTAASCHVTRAMERAHLPTKSTAAPLGEVIPCVGEWKRVTPEWRNTSEKKKKKEVGEPTQPPAALQRNMVTSWATSGIMGSESENEGVRVER